jgi:putative colanic acid biosynthesis UDP-glucose lipid carrier transferase
MYRHLNLFKIASLNIGLVFLLINLVDSGSAMLIKIIMCLINAGFIILVLHNLPKFLQLHTNRFLIGRKRTLIFCASTMYLMATLFSLWNEISVSQVLVICLLITIIVSLVYICADAISAFLQKVFKQNQRIAIVGYDENAHKLIATLKRKKNGCLISHLGHYNSVTNTETTGILSEYLDYAQKNHISEFYISIPEQQQYNGITTLVEEAEKHCIRVNLIVQDQLLDPEVYHLNHIGGLPVLRRYKEPLNRLHKQILKRSFDLLVSTLVIIFILSWLIPLITILVKLESKGPVFFKQLRTGRDNDEFTCLKFRSMHADHSSEATQVVKNDKRVTRVGAFLRKTSLDEFPQFLNVFMGDMSIVGPRPHMVQHTQQYKGQINHYMVRLYLKPGVTGWAQVNGYRGEIKNIGLMKNRVEHDIWYMENWKIWLDIKIMFLTLVNVLKGDENAY